MGTARIPGLDTSTVIKNNNVNIDNNTNCAFSCCHIGLTSEVVALLRWIQTEAWTAALYRLISIKYTLCCVCMAVWSELTCRQRLQVFPLTPEGAASHSEAHLSDTAKTIVCSMVDVQLDYCNSVLYGMLATNLNKLRVQNSAARIVTGSRRCEHALPILAELHWLPIKHRIQYKIAVTVFKVLTTQQPSYLANIVRFHAASR